MDQLEYQNKILELIEKISKEEDRFYKQMANALRLYYLDLNDLFITQRVLKNINFSPFNLDQKEKKHIENAGWLLDETYLRDVYLPAIKTNLVLNSWLIFKGNTKKENTSTNSFQILINSFFNDIKATEDTAIDLGDGINLNLEKDKTITSITPEITLKIVEKLISMYS